jgi:hypothetical protein
MKRTARPIVHALGQIALIFPLPSGAQAAME